MSVFVSILLTKNYKGVHNQLGSFSSLNPEHKQVFLYKLHVITRYVKMKG